MAAHGEKWQPENRERGGREIKRRVEDERAEQNHVRSIPQHRGECEEPTRTFDLRWF
jgi:hypothetical protein